MAGYDGYSMSSNARDAYADGKLPLSKFKAADLKAAGWTDTLAFARWLARKKHWRPSEWHHTSKEFNATDFYDVADLIAWWIDLDAAEQDALRQEFRTPDAAPEERVTGTYIEWTGTRRHPKPITHEFAGTLRGDWIYVDGGPRKLASGRHIEYRRAEK